MRKLEVGDRFKVTTFSNNYLSYKEQDAAVALTAACKALLTQLGVPYPHLLETPLGEKVEPLFAAAIVHFAVTLFGQNLPGGEVVLKASERAVTAGVKDTYQEGKAMVEPMILSLATTLVEMQSNIKE